MWLIHSKSQHSCVKSLRTTLFEKIHFENGKDIGMDVLKDLLNDKFVEKEQLLVAEITNHHTKRKVMLCSVKTGEEEGG